MKLYMRVIMMVLFFPGVICTMDDIQEVTFELVDTTNKFAAINTADLDNDDNDDVVQVVDHDPVAIQLADLEAGQSGPTHEQLAQEAYEFGHYRHPGGCVDDEDDASTEVDSDSDDEKLVALAPKKQTQDDRARKRVRKRVKKGKGLLRHSTKQIGIDASGAGGSSQADQAPTCQGLDELEAGVGVSSQSNQEPTIEQVAAVLCNRLNGKIVPELSDVPFDMNNQDQREGMLRLLKTVRAVDEFTGSNDYEIITHSIVRGKRTQRKNQALINQLGKIVTAINAMNDDTSRLAQQANELTIESLRQQNRANELTIKASRRTEQRWRWGFVGTATTTVLGPIVACIVTYFATYVSPNDIAEMCDGMQQMDITGS